uniref:permease-like cell division protein FtsX n=1 Tax=Ningiella ruwaisensis TaxID=2364274 RepID=UPI00109EF653|nr:permease-like cell division protein FtsX [Ningiella ruwaisensis]
MSILFKGRKQGASIDKVGPFQRLVMFFTDHLRQAVNSLGELYRTPFASLMTVGVLGFSLTLPGTLYILVKNTEQISEQWQQASEISLFLNDSVSEANAQQLVTRLSVWDEIASVTYISPEEALEEFKALSGLGDAIEYLNENPLPAVVLVVPTSKHATPTAAAILLDKLRQEREVEMGKLDIEWLERLYALLDIAKELVFLLAVLLFFAVVLIIGNTIRLNILNRRDEILVMKLVGATDAFIQRPFLYTGFWFGLLGGVIAWVTVSAILWWIGWSLEDFMALYQVKFDITGLDAKALGIMLLLSIGLGLLGSMLSVKRHVKEIEPE